MQIQHYQTIQSTAALPTSPTTSQSVTNATLPAIQEGVQVSISAQAQQLAEAEKHISSPLSAQPVPLPEKPTQALTGEKLEQAVKIKKAQMHYQVASDMVNLATGNSNGISAPSTYYLSKNEDAREVVLQTKSQQQSLANMQAYQEQTQAINERYA